MSNMSSTKGEGALRRIARDPVSRRRFFALGGGTGAAAFLAACGSSDDTTSSTSSTAASTATDDMASQFGEGDLGIVNYALTLEYLETAFYNDAAKSGLFKGDDLALIKHIADTEQQHVDALTATAKKLGGPAAKAAEGRVPAQGPEVGAEAGRDGREPRRGGLPRPGGEHPVARHPGRGARRSTRSRAATPRRSTCSPARSRPRTGRSPRAPTCRKSSTRSSRSSSKATDTRKEATCNRHKQAGSRARQDRGRGPQPQRAADARRARRRRALRHRARSRRSSARPSPRARAGDIDILNYALTLEYLEAAFYEGAAKTPGLSKEVAGYVKTFGDEEQEHVDALMTTIKDIGGTPVEAPKVDFGDAFTSADKLVPLAITFEDTGVSAYNGAAPMIQSKDLLATAGGIVQVEARHAATIRLAAGENPAPDAFDPTLTHGRGPEGRPAVRAVMRSRRADRDRPGGQRGACSPAAARATPIRRPPAPRQSTTTSDDRGGGGRQGRDRRLRLRPRDDHRQGRHEGHLDELRRRDAHRDRRRRLVRHRRPRQGGLEEHHLRQARYVTPTTAGSTRS